jgi:hypothetical protein
MFYGRCSNSYARYDDPAAENPFGFQVRWIRRR